MAFDNGFRWPGLSGRSRDGLNGLCFLIGKTMYEQSILDGVPNTFFFRITGRMTKGENERISRLLEKEISRLGTIRLIIMIDYYQSTDNAEALFEDLNFVKIHSNFIERMAVIGNKGGQDTGVGLFGLFGGIETEYFDASEMEKSKRWIRKM